jgi:hypothetical protein
MDDRTDWAAEGAKFAEKTKRYIARDKAFAEGQTRIAKRESILGLSMALLVLGGSIFMFFMPDLRVGSLYVCGIIIYFMICKLTNRYLAGKELERINKEFPKP